jgi:hypothetical protein
MSKRRPALARLLVPEAGVASTPGRAPVVPPEWIANAHSNPALWQLIRPTHRLPIPSPDPVEDHTISTYFDNRGNLINLHVGSGAGRLAP